MTANNNRQTIYYNNNERVLVQLASGTYVLVHRWGGRVNFGPSSTASAKRADLRLTFRQRRSIN